MLTLKRAAFERQAFRAIFRGAAPLSIQAARPS